MSGKLDSCEVTRLVVEEIKENVASEPAGGVAPEKPGEGEPEPAGGVAGKVEAAEPIEGPDPVEALQAALDEKTRLADEYFARLARVSADFENYRRRTQKEKEELYSLAAEQMVVKFLPVLDNLERALKATEGEGWREGVEMTLRQFRDLLAREGITPIEAEGQPFDPNLHDAVMQVEGDQEEPVVVEVFQKGYRLGDKVIRPSLVKVSRK